MTLLNLMRAGLSRWRRDEAGATAILFALMVTPILCIALVAIDYSKAYSRQGKLQDTADAATNAAAKILGSPHDEVEGVIRAFMQANLAKGDNTYSYEVTFAPEDRAVTMRVNDRVPTSILKLAGVREVEINVESTAERHNPPIEKKAPHRGIDPDDEHASPLTSAGGNEPSQEEQRQAERAIRQIVQELEQHGADMNVRQLLRELRHR